MRKIRIEQLSAESGLGVSTIRYYQRKKLLHSPVLEGRIAWYGTSHLKRIREIQRLQEKGFSLRQILTLPNGISASTDPILAALDSSASITYEELMQKSGLSSGIIDLAIQEGLIWPIPNMKNRYYADSAEMLLVAGRLISAGIDPQALLSLATTHAANIEKTATDAVLLFAKSIRKQKTQNGSTLSGEQLSEEIQALLPQVSMLVTRHFNQMLVAKAAEYVLKSQKAKAKAKAKTAAGKK